MHVFSRLAKECEDLIKFYNEAIGPHQVLGLPDGTVLLRLGQLDFSAIRWRFRTEGAPHPAEEIKVAQHLDRLETSTERNQEKQVKSTMSPRVFGGPESVRRIIEHPLAIFLCIVQKAEAGIIVCHPTSRFAVWALPTHPNRLELIPGTEMKAHTVEWATGDTFNLRAPILNFTIQEVLDSDFRLPGTESRHDIKQESSKELRKCASELLAALRAIRCYWVFKVLLWQLPPKAEVQEAARLLIGLSNASKVEDMRDAWKETDRLRRILDVRQ